MSRKNEFTFIGAGTEINGNLISSELRIDGEFEGKIECSDLLLVGKTGVVKAEITAKSLEVAGKIYGNIVCEKKIELLEGASIYGNITAKEFIINKGAIFHGNSNMSDGYVAESENLVELDLDINSNNSK